MLVMTLNASKSVNYMQEAVSYRILQERSSIGFRYVKPGDIAHFIIIIFSLLYSILVTLMVGMLPAMLEDGLSSI